MANIEPLVFDSLPKSYIHKFQASNPELASLTDKEIELYVYGNISTVVYEMYYLISEYIKSASDKVSIEAKVNLLNEATSKLQQKLMVYNCRNEALEAMCGNSTEITRYLSHEESVFIKVFKQTVMKHTQLYFQSFVSEYSEYSSYDEILFCHKSINKILLNTKASASTNHAFHDKINRKLILQLENLLSFFQNELERAHAKITTPQTKSNTDLMIDRGAMTRSSIREFEKQENTDIIVASFDSIFIPPFKTHIEDFIELLRNVEPQVIANDNRWCPVGNKCGVMRLFLKLLKDKKIVHYEMTRQTYGVAIANKFPGLKCSFIDSQAKDNNIVSRYLHQLEPKIIELKEKILISNKKSSVNLRLTENRT